MFVETIQSKRGGFSMRSVFLQTGLTNSKWRPWISVCSTHDSLFQSKEKGMPQNSFYIISSRVYKNLEKQRIPNNFNGGHL